MRGAARPSATPASEMTAATAHAPDSNSNRRHLADWNAASQAPRPAKPAPLRTTLPSVPQKKRGPGLHRERSSGVLVRNEPMGGPQGPCLSAKMPREAHSTANGRGSHRLVPNEHPAAQRQKARPAQSHTNLSCRSGRTRSRCRRSTRARAGCGRRGAGRRGRSRRRLLRACSARRATRELDRAALARQVLARARRVRHADHAWPAASPCARCSRPGSGSGKQLADLHVAPLAHRTARARARGARPVRGGASSSSSRTCSAAATLVSTGSVGLAAPDSRLLQVARGMPAIFAICCCERPRASRSASMLSARWCDACSAMCQSIPANGLAADDSRLADACACSRQEERTMKLVRRRPCWSRERSRGLGARSRTTLARARRAGRAGGAATRAASRARRRRSCARAAAAPTRSPPTSRQGRHPPHRRPGAGRCSVRSTCWSTTRARSARRRCAACSTPSARTSRARSR